MAYRQVVEFGMSPTIGHISLPHKKPSEPAKRMYSDKLARMIDQVLIRVQLYIINFSTFYRMMQMVWQWWSHAYYAVAQNAGCS